MKGVGPYRIFQVISNAPIQNSSETADLLRMLSLTGMDEETFLTADDMKPKYYTLPLCTIIHMCITCFTPQYDVYLGAD